jgi:hypothetical protein
MVFGVHFEEKFASIKLSLIEIPESILGSLLGSEFHYSNSTGPASIVLKNIRAYHVASLAHVVLQILPLGFESQV